MYTLLFSNLDEQLAARAKPGFRVRMGDCGDRTKEGHTPPLWGPGYYLWKICRIVDVNLRILVHMYRRYSTA
jgi:hypothetical protein